MAEITEEIIIDQLRKLNNHKSPVIDGITDEVIKIENEIMIDRL